jgi:hypothetical protein
MSISTFDGPVRSLNGFYVQGPGNFIDLSTTADTTLTVAQHAGRILRFAGGSLAASRTITLPAINSSADPSSAGPGSDPNTPNNLGVTFTIWITGTISTSSLKIGTTAASDDVYIGSVLTVDTDSSGAMAGFAPGATNDFINLNGSTTGGVGGTWLRITAYAADKYSVVGILLCTGTPATPFADS